MENEIGEKVKFNFYCGVRPRLGKQDPHRPVLIRLSAGSGSALTVCIGSETSWGAGTPGPADPRSVGCRGTKWRQTGPTAGAGR